VRLSPVESVGFLTVPERHKRKKNGQRSVHSLVLKPSISLVENAKWLTPCAPFSLSFKGDISIYHELHIWSTTFLHPHRDPPLLLPIRIVCLTRRQDGCFHHVSIPNTVSADIRLAAVQIPSCVMLEQSQSLFRLQRCISLLLHSFYQLSVYYNQRCLRIYELCILLLFSKILGIRPIQSDYSPTDIRERVGSSRLFRVRGEHYLLRVLSKEPRSRKQRYSELDDIQLEQDYRHPSYR
jgi:hypothetical protein